MAATNEKMRKGFSPVTVLFIAAIAAVVLIAFVTLQQYAAVNAQGSSSAFSQANKVAYEETVKNRVGIAKSVENASIGLGENGGVAPEKYWYCNSANPPTIEELSLSLCAETKKEVLEKIGNRSLSDGTNVNVSGSDCIDAQVLDDEIIASEGGGNAVIGNEKESAVVDFQGEKVEVDKNRLGYVFRKMSSWANSTESIGAGFCKALSSSGCQARQCIYEENATGIINETAIEGLQVHDEDVRMALMEIAENLTQSFNDGEINCTYEIDENEINYTNTPNYTYAQRSTCGCEGGQISNGSSWVDWNGLGVDEPQCVLINDTEPARCGGVYSVSAYYDDPTELGIAEKLGVVVNGCGDPEKQCFYSSNVLLAFSNLTDAEAGRIAASATGGKVVIANHDNYVKLKGLIGGNEISAVSAENEQVTVNYFAAGNGRNGVVIEGVSGSMTELEQAQYADLYYSIASNMTDQPFNAANCSEAGFAAAPRVMNECTVKKQLLALQEEGGSNGVATHEMVGMNRGIEVKFTLACTDSKYSIVTDEGMKNLVLKTKYYVKMERDCPAPKECS